MALELLLFDGTDRRFVLNDGTEMLVGAAANCPVRLSAIDVSRSHALVTCRKGRLMVLDLGSTNGTFVNGKRVKEAELRPGDSLRFSSVMGQIVPSTRSSGGDGDGAGEPTAPDRPAERRTSDRLPTLWLEGLNRILGRWGSGGESALSVFAEWCVTAGGARGAAVLARIDGEVAVLAAHGGVSPLLEDPECQRLADRGGDVAAMESIAIEIAGHPVQALCRPRKPCLILVQGSLSHDASELDLMVKLLDVALRLDGGGQPR